MQAQPFASPSGLLYSSPVHRSRPVAMRAGRYGRIYRLGLGDLPSGQAIAAGTVAGTVTGAAVAQSTGSAAAGAVAGGLLALAPFTGPAAPFVAAAGALIGPILKLFSGCGQNCVLATQYANQAETALEQMVNQYFAQPVRYQSSQTAALSYIQQVFTALQASCSSPSLGTAGQKCISDRLPQSACTWKASPSSFNGCTYTPAGPAGSGSACWNWYVGYYQPILNDPCVVPDPAAAAGSSVLSSLGISPTASIGGVPIADLILPAAVLVALALVL